MKLKWNEDWLSFSTGLALISLALWSGGFPMPKFAWKEWTDLSALAGRSNLLANLLLFFLLTSVAFTTRLLGGKRLFNLLLGVLLLYILSLCAQLLAGYEPVKNLGIEYVIFALLLGIVIRALIGNPAWLQEALQSEFYIKTGLVLLGAGIIFQDVVKAGALGLIQALVIVISVWYFTYWLARRFRIDNELGVMLSSAVSICGVSAAIATCGAIQGDGKKLSYVVSLVLIVALPMMLLMPPLAKVMGLEADVAGAWIGGTIDTTGAVVATGAQLGEEALKISTIVKLSQNVLLGLAAVVISFFWMMSRQANGTTAKPQWSLIWERFPKFVLGFVLASLVFSFALSPSEASANAGFIKGIQTSLFSLAFVSIGLETDLGALVRTGNGRPALVFVMAQGFNVLVTLLVAYLLFHGG